MKLPLLIAAVALLLSGCGWHFADVRVTVLEKHYAPSSTSIGFGGFGKHSGMMVNSIPESFTLICREPDGRVASHEVNANEYGDAVVGQSLTISELVYK